MSKLLTAFILAVLTLLISGCMSTDVPRGDREDVREALQEQHKLAIELYLKRLVDVNKLMLPILRANNEICGPVSGHRIGVSILTKRMFPPNIRRVAEEEFGIGSRPVIYLIPDTPAANSSLQNGDRLYQINDKKIGDNPWSHGTAHNTLKDALKKGDPITLTVMRRGSHEQIVEVLEPEPMCMSFVYLLQDGSPNAYADGDDIFVFTGMIKEVESDNEMQVVLGHELAHNAMSHIAKTGGIGLAGSILDVILGDEGDEDDEGLFADLAMIAFSPAFEREADYVGLYMIARAGLDTQNASAFWKRLSVEYPGENQRTLLSTHPIHAERFVNLDKAHEEIVKKIAAKEPLIPESR
ncbi:MAG: M48 family metalloprotease [Gammaproteobacteria bacterium]|nr:M48 family metalloprotease [Gammaproteobacteria bacterium]MYC24486.1 M48 family metalloprotease [Gammaproteobacteria bacterium]